MTFRKLIPSYIDGRLDDRTLNEFLIHLKSCPSCMEELEIHYIVMKGVDILDTDSGDYNLSAKFRATVEDSSQFLKKRKRLMRLEYVIDTLVFWGVSASLILYFNKFLQR